MVYFYQNIFDNIFCYLRLTDYYYLLHNRLLTYSTPTPLPTCTLQLLYVQQRMPIYRYTHVSGMLPPWRMRLHVYTYVSSVFRRTSKLESARVSTCALGAHALLTEAASALAYFPIRTKCRIFLGL